MELVYFYVINAMLLSGNDAVKTPSGPVPPFNIGYIAIIVCFMVWCVMNGTLIVRQVKGKPMTATTWVIFGVVTILCFAGVWVGGEYHTKFLQHWYATH
jgi:hypothetical protein